MTRHEDMHKLPPSLDRLLPSYRGLLTRAVEVLGADERVRGMWLSGSLARGVADRASDLDVVLAVTNDHHEAFASSWRSWLADITPTVLAGELPMANGGFWSVTPDCERFDVVVEPVSAVPTSDISSRIVVFDRDDLTARLPVPTTREPSPAEVSRLVNEWFRFSAMLETVLWRNDWLLAAEHLHFLARLLYELYVESNQPLPPMGVKRWSEKLTDDQRATLGRLPRTATSAEQLTAAHLAFCRAFIGAARPLAQRVGAVWPSDLESATSRHLREVLGVAEPYPS